jgi:AcrR family transcriptional regulator
MTVAYDRPAGVRRPDDPSGVDGATYNRLLETAERLFAQHGFGAVSVRAVTIEAATNIAAVHYHFGSKIELLRAIYLHRSVLLNAERERLLAEAMCAAGGKPRVADIIRAFVEPAFRTPPSFCELSAKIAVETSPEVRTIASETIGAVVPQFIEALIAVRPDLRRDEIAWRFLCLVGTVMYARVDTGLIQRITGESAGTLEREVAVESIMPFLIAGFDAPASAMPATEPSATRGRFRATNRRR